MKNSCVFLSLRTLALEHPGVPLELPRPCNQRQARKNVACLALQSINVHSCRS